MSLIGAVVWICTGGAEKLKTRERNRREWKTRHQVAGMEKAEVKNVASSSKSGKRGSG